jgi:hypothetical protein
MTRKCGILFKLWLLHGKRVHNDTVHSFELVTTLHVVHIVINQDGPGTVFFVVIVNALVFIGKIQKRCPLVQRNFLRRRLRDPFQKRAIARQAIGRDLILQHQPQQINDQLLVQGSMCSLPIELKTKLNMKCKHPNSHQNVKTCQTTTNNDNSDSGTNTNNRSNKSTLKKSLNSDRSRNPTSRPGISFFNLAIESAFN